MRRFLLLLLLALLLQGTVFALYYDDLLFLRQPLDSVVAVPASTFRAHAEAALDRDRLTVRHLDRITGGARAFGQIDLELAALERRAELSSGDAGARLEWADALRRAGRLTEARSIYHDILGLTRDQRR